MPSDDRANALAVLEMLRGAIGEYQQRAAFTAEQVRVLLDADSEPPARER